MRAVRSNVRPQLGASTCRSSRTSPRLGRRRRALIGTDERPDPRPGREVEYRGEPLDAARGPGLGCFWLQVVALTIVVVLTPLSAAWNWPIPVTIVLFSATLVLLLFVGQTVIFLLRLVAADRRATGRRRPMRSTTKTVGEIEDEAPDDEPGGELDEEPGDGAGTDGGERG